MDKIIERLLIEFLVPALLMLLCFVLIGDLWAGSSFDLPRALTSGIDLNISLFFVGLLAAYLVNTSASSFLNLLMRGVVWGRVREYLMYRKLDVFKAAPFKGITCAGYLIRYRDKSDEAKNAVKADPESLVSVLETRLLERRVPARWTRLMVDVYDVVRTAVMSSQDSAVISWIDYHWSQLRLARSTLLPAAMLMVLLPVSAITWGWRTRDVLAAAVVGVTFCLLQLCHYYYRERFMIYAMLSYFLVAPREQREVQQDVLAKN